MKLITYPIIGIVSLGCFLQPTIQANELNCGIITTKINNVSRSEARIQLVSHNGTLLSDNNSKPLYRLSLEPGLHTFTGRIRSATRSESSLNVPGTSAFGPHEAAVAYRSRTESEVTGGGESRSARSSREGRDAVGTNQALSFGSASNTTGNSSGPVFSFQFNVETNKTYRISAVAEEDPSSAGQYFVDIKTKSKKDSICTLTPVRPLAKTAKAKLVGNKLPPVLAAQLGVLSQDISSYFNSHESANNTINISVAEHFSANFGVLISDTNELNVGLMVQSVMPNSSASQLGLLAGDNIISIQHVELAHSDLTAIKQLKDQLMATPIGGQLMMSVMRDKRITKLQGIASVNRIPKLILSIG